jgi:hypothetical protein
MRPVLASDKPSAATRLQFRLRRIRRRLLGNIKYWLQQKRWRIDLSLMMALGVMIATPSFTHPLVARLGHCWRVCSINGWAASIGLLLLAVALFVVAFKSVTMIARIIVWSRIHLVDPSDSRCRVLIMGLSDDLVPVGGNTRLNEITELFVKHGWATSPAYPAFVIARIKSVFAGRAECYAKPTSEYSSQIDIGDAESLRALVTRWQQNVRAVVYHGEALEAVYVLPSQKSMAQWSEFVAFMHALFPALKVKYVRADDGDFFRRPSKPNDPPRDYESHAYVWAGLLEAIDQAIDDFAAAGRLLADDEICIDVTPGQKTFSIAGASVTLNRELRLSYVSPDGHVRVYQAEADTADALRRVVNAGGAGG